MKSELMKRWLIPILVIVFTLTAGLAFAVQKHWFVFKDDQSLCKLTKTVKKPPRTIAGPFNTEKEARKWKGKHCAARTESGTGYLHEKYKPSERRWQKQESVEPLQRYRHTESADQRRHKQRQGEQIRVRQPQSQEMKAKTQERVQEKAQEKVQEKIQGDKPSAQKHQEKKKPSVPADTRILKEE